MRNNYKQGIWNTCSLPIERDYIGACLQVLYVYKNANKRPNIKFSGNLFVTQSLFKMRNTKRRTDRPTNRINPQPTWTLDYVTGGFWTTVCQSCGWS